MDTWWILLLSLIVISTAECSVTEEPECDADDGETFTLLEGEAFYYVPEAFRFNFTSPTGEFTWSKQVSNRTTISSNTSHRIHHQDEKLFFLHLLKGDSGLYSARNIDQSGECSMYYLEIRVLKSTYKSSRKVLFPKIDVSDDNINVPCPVPVRNICGHFKGNYSWFRRFILLHDKHKDHLWVKNDKANEDIYTCLCTWTYNHRVYNSSGSRWVMALEKLSPRLEILSPSNNEQVVREGSQVKLNCSALCGYNLKGRMLCKTSWNVAPVDGYSQNSTLVTYNTSKKETVSSTILTIDKVSDKDFRTIFNCTAVGPFEVHSATLTLKRRASIVPLVTGGLCVFLVCVVAAVLVKCFAVDLALFFRPYLPVSRHSKDVKTYDAYVVYRTQHMDKVTEDTLCQFVTTILPSVLEEKCGYRLFIHGRDDIPGEDHLELVEDRMRQSRRLIVILTLDSKSRSRTTEKDPVSPQNSLIGGFDWQVGLHHALVQREMNVILIQLGDTGPRGYTHLPPGLQHLIRKSAPIKWPQNSRGAAARNSRFWKRVRYLMPVTPLCRFLSSAPVSVWLFYCGGCSVDHQQ